MYLFVDTSFNAHEHSNRLHHGMICYIGTQGGPVASVSKMLSECICLSATESTESEYKAISTAAKYAVRSH